MTRLVLMSIRPVYADAIFDRRKTAEFRKRAPKPGSEILVYRSGGLPADRGIVGVFTAGTVAHGTALDHFRVVTAPGISLVDLEAYAGGPDRPVWRIEVTRAIKFSRPVPLAALGVARAPQSWQYVWRNPD